MKNPRGGEVPAVPCPQGSTKGLRLSQRPGASRDSRVYSDPRAPHPPGSHPSSLSFLHKAHRCSGDVQGLPSSCNWARKLPRGLPSHPTTPAPPCDLRAGPVCRSCAASFTCTRARSVHINGGCLHAPSLEPLSFFLLFPPLSTTSHSRSSLCGYGPYFSPFSYTHRFTHRDAHTYPHTQTPGVHALPYKSEILSTQTSQCLASLPRQYFLGRPIHRVGIPKSGPSPPYSGAQASFRRCHCRTAQYKYPYLRVPRLPGGGR